MITNYFAVHIISCYGRHINLIIAADTFDDMLEKIVIKVINTKGFLIEELDEMYVTCTKDIDYSDDILNFKNFVGVWDDL